MGCRIDREAHDTAGGVGALGGRTVASRWVVTSGPQVDIAGGRVRGAKPGAGWVRPSSLGEFDRPGGNRGPKTSRRSVRTERRPWPITPPLTTAQARRAGTMGEVPERRRRDQGKARLGVSEVHVVRDGRPRVGAARSRVRGPRIGPEGPHVRADPSQPARASPSRTSALPDAVEEEDVPAEPLAGRRDSIFVGSRAYRQLGQHTRERAPRRERL